jgi:hypothetical protein
MSYFDGRTEAIRVSVGMGIETFFERTHSPLGVSDAARSFDGIESSRRKPRRKRQSKSGLRYDTRVKGTERMSFPRCGWPVLPAKRCLPSGSAALFICALGRQGSAIHHATIPSCFSIILFVRSNIRMPNLGSGSGSLIRKVKMPSRVPTMPMAYPPTDRADSVPLLS